MLCSTRPFLLALCVFWAGPLNGASSSKTNLWSLKPLDRPALPHLSSTNAAARNPIDFFIQERLEKAGLSLSPPATRAELIRRVYYDLTGLPPSWNGVDSFVRSTDPQVYEKLIDQLLASPRYGERWARHWLDLVHFGETHGYDKDKPRLNAWPYRDYVIDALNRDEPFGKFLEKQIAGDLLFPEERDRVVALGFLSAGPWDLIGHEEVPETKIDGKIARHLDRDDMVMNSVQTFTALTVQCAQCHNHKFDPISQEDYYSLQAVFAGVDRTDRKYDADPVIERRRAALAERAEYFRQQQRAMESNLAQRAGAPLALLESVIKRLERSRAGDAYGYHSAIAATATETKWVQLDLGRMVELTNVSLHPCRDDFNQIGDGFGFPVRFKLELSNDPDFQTEVRVLANETRADFPSPGIKPVSYEASGLPARYLRMTATQLAPRQNDFIFALAELKTVDREGKNAALQARVSSLDSTDAPIRWQKENLIDAWYPGAPPSTNLLADLKKERDALRIAQQRPEEAEADRQLERDLAAIVSQEKQLPPPSVAYVAAVHRGSGNFKGTGPEGGKPRPIHLLSRGNVQRPGREVGPGALTAVPGLPARFELTPGAPEGERRAALARWLSSPQNPLTWRVIVNRIWQYHFGQGLVATANDFGKMGEPASHPELLDWLGATFRDEGQSIKQLHRLILTSQVYRQSSQAPPVLSERASKHDVSNRLLWKMNRRKLEAEAIRDSLLFHAGQLNLAMGGASFQDFVIEKPEHSPHYQYHLADPNDPRTHRRSIYRFVVRSQPQPLMAALDCADPSIQTAGRSESLSPLQALAFLNSGTVLAAAEIFGDKLKRLSSSRDDQVRMAFIEVLGREPSSREKREMIDFAREHGLAAFCRVLFNLNEFVFVD